MNRHEVIRQALADPAPGCIRMFRVDNRTVSPDSWCRLPTPSGDCPDPGEPERKRRLWGDWQCATDAEWLANWWPGEDLETAISRANTPRVYEVPEDQAYWCGTQFIYNPAAARPVMELM